MTTREPPRDPQQVFRDRLHAILSELVGRLEDLSDEVLPGSTDDVRRTSPDRGTTIPRPR